MGSLMALGLAALALFVALGALITAIAACAAASQCVEHVGDLEANCPRAQGKNCCG